MNNITSLTLLETIEGIGQKKFSLVELNKAYIEKIGKIDKKLNSFLNVNIKSDKIPAGFKDVYSTLGFETTAGSKILKGYNPVYSATVVERLEEKGISVLGKLNCDEFAMGSSGENSAYGVTHNPWDLARVSGGSSSGSAAAVSTDLCTFSLGTDTGGSIRLPASLCGVVGLKPSYGRVSRYGVLPMASSLDCPGPITKTVSDARQVLEWISGEDEKDSNAVSDRLKITDKKDLKNIKIGIPKEYFAKGIDMGVEIAVKKAISKFEELGANIIEISLPYTEYAVATYYIIASSEISSNLARFDGIRFGSKRDDFGSEVKRRIILGTYSLSSGYYEDYYVKASKVRTLIKEDFEKAFKLVDVIVCPVSPTVAWKIGERSADPLKMYLSDIFTVPASLSGLPALSIPCGFSENMPVGLQIIGKYLDEDTILNIGEAYENETRWINFKPQL